MCYRHTICPLYKPDGLCEECLNCVYLQKAKRSVRMARIGLLVVFIAFLFTTYMVW